MPESTKLILVDDCRTEGMLVEGAVEASEAFTNFSHIIDSRQAASVIAQEQPDAVLLDLRMPGLSGWEVLDQLKSMDLLSKVYVAILSNSNSLSDRKEALGRGAKAYFVKPMDARGYHEIIEEVAGGLLR